MNRRAGTFATAVHAAEMPSSLIIVGLLARDEDGVCWPATGPALNAKGREPVAYGDVRSTRGTDGRTTHGHVKLPGWLKGKADEEPYPNTFGYGERM